MNHLLLPVLTALLIGLLVGVLTMWDGKVESVSENGNSRPAALSSSASEEEPRLVQLEREIKQLKVQLTELQQQLDQRPQTDEDAALTDSENIADEDRPADPLTRENLVNAGVSTELASDIMRRLGEQEYQRLALRDRAIREGYFRSGRYFRELRELRQNQLSLRDEIGDPAYDRYLYQSGQNNRVAVASVMAGSPAEQTGMRQGDVLLRYNNQDVFTWNEIRQATSQGQLGEYVTLDVLRDGQPLSLMLPRGPLGVKLDATRVDPQQVQP